MCHVVFSLLQDKLDFRDPLMVSLDFGLVDTDSGPVLDEALPTSLNKTVIFSSDFQSKGMVVVLLPNTSV